MVKQAIQPFTAPSEIQGAVKGEQGRGEKESSLLWMSKSAEECGRHWRCQVTLVAAAAESCRSGQVVEKAPGRPLLFSDTSGSHEAVSGDLFLKKGHLSKNGGSQDSA